MERFGRGPEKEKFFKFAEAIERRVSDIGASKSSSVRAADAVMERLFRSSGGDASRVTDDQIAEAFDTIHKKRGQE